MSRHRERTRLAFDRREDVDDGAGNAVGGWVEQFQCDVAMVEKFGGESVIADRLTGSNTYIVKIDYWSQSSVVTTDWRARNVRSHAIYNIRSVTNLKQQNRQIEMLLQSGVAA